MPKTIIKAAASYAEVEEALKAFLARHPEVAKDSSIARGASLDSILKGAIASMTFEGEGSLFDTLNFGTRNPEQDAAVVADLQETLRGIGCYYEQGHDWSLGVYPLDDTAEDAAARGLLDSLAAALGEDADDLKVEDTTETSEGPVVRVSHGSKEYLVGSDMALHRMAVDRYEDEVNSDPENFLPKEYMGWIDRRQAREAAEAVAQELAESDADDLRDREKREWLEKADMLPAPANPEEDADPTDEQVVAAFAEHWSEWVEERASESIGSDPIAYLEEMSGGEDEFKKYALKEGLIDIPRLAEDVVSNDGFENSLGGSLQEKDGLTYLEM